MHILAAAACVFCTFFGGQKAASESAIIIEYTSPNYKSMIHSNSLCQVVNGNQRHQVGTTEESNTWHYPYVRPFLPSDLWLHNIIPHLDGRSLLQLSLCCKDNYTILVTNARQKNVVDDLGTHGWEKCCRQRWPSVKQFPISTSKDIEIKSHQATNNWYECYRHMHCQDKKADDVLSILLKQKKTRDECFDVLHDFFCSDISMDQLFDGLLQKCSIQYTMSIPISITSPFTRPSKVLAGLMLLEVNQLFSMQRLCSLWRAHGINTSSSSSSTTSSSSVILQGALLIAQFCQSVSELIQRKSLYTLEEECTKIITKIADRIKSKVNGKRVNAFHQNSNELHTHWIAEMRHIFSNAPHGSLEHHENDDEVSPFCGNKDNYYDWHNSLLDKVIQTRKGIPISLCIIYASIIYHAAGFDLDFIGLPGHFLLRLPLQTEEEAQSLNTDSSHMIFIDAYDCGRLYNRQEVLEIVEVGYGIPWSEKYISPLTPDKIWTRMIVNIVNTARDFSTPSQTVLLDVVKRRLDIAHFSAHQEKDIKEMTHRLFHLSPLRSFESDDIVALSNQ